MISLGFVDMNLFRFLLRLLPPLRAEIRLTKILTMFSLEMFAHTKKINSLLFSIDWHFRCCMCLDMFIDNICAQLFVLGHTLFVMTATAFLQDVHVAYIYKSRLLSNVNSFEYGVTSGVVKLDDHWLPILKIFF